LVSTVLLIFGSMAARGPMISWVAMHRRHHECADRDGDMHSPVVAGGTVLGRLRGWAHSHVTWMLRHDYPNVMHYVPDLIKDKPLMRQNQRYYTWVLLGLALPAGIGGCIGLSWM